MKHHINHPMADSVSVVSHTFAYAGEDSSEIAFFRGKDWVTEIIEPFGAYADSMAGDTRVYGWVPNEMIDDFLETYRA